MDRLRSISSRAGSGHSRSKSASGNIAADVKPLLPPNQDPSPPQQHEAPVRAPPPRMTRAVSTILKTAQQSQSSSSFFNNIASNNSRAKSHTTKGGTVSPPLVATPSSSSLMPTTEGYLVKRGKIRKNWKKRYFRIVDSKLNYYLSNRETKAKGCIDLKDVIQIEAVKDDKTATSLGVYGLHHVFRVQTKQRVYLLQAPTAQDLDNWIKGLLAQVIYLDPLFSSSSHSRHSKSPDSKLSPSTSFADLKESIFLCTPENLQSILTDERHAYDVVTKQISEANRVHHKIQEEVRTLNERLGEEEDIEMRQLFLLLQTKYRDEKTPIITNDVNDAREKIESTEALIENKTATLRELEVQTARLLDVQSFIEVKIERLRTKASEAH